MDHFDSVIDNELFVNAEEEEKLIQKLLKCQTYKEFQALEIDINSEAAKSIFKSATLTYTGTVEAKDVIRRLPSVISGAEFI